MTGTQTEPSLSDDALVQSLRRSKADQEVIDDAISRLTQDNYVRSADRRPRRRR